MAATAAFTALTLSAVFVAEIEAGGESREQRTAIERSVQACVEVVRLQSPSGRFTAYVVDDRVRANGSHEEAVRFQRCMEARGKNLHRPGTEPPR